eukprot:scaffold1837_cov391-Prasinococcus_capsulatus_cf.AAC.10
MSVVNTVESLMSSSAMSSKLRATASMSSAGWQLPDGDAAGTAKALGVDAYVLHEALEEMPDPVVLVCGSDEHVAR